ncbi:MAG: hypothetical protein SFT81_01215 [Candidatus Caenarcaniphilales bacterium]|nr:hypothetical protein [Candidatus Caenarcaniphilales bacterium]
MLTGQKIKTPMDRNLAKVSFVFALLLMSAACTPTTENKTGETGSEATTSDTNNAEVTQSCAEFDEGFLKSCNDSCNTKCKEQLIQHKDEAKMNEDQISESCKTKCEEQCNSTLSKVRPEQCK